MKNLAILLFLAPFLSWAQFPIGSRTITYNDPARSDRAVECEIYYPGVSVGSNVAAASGTFPVIVFGHGFAMQVGAYPNWREEFVPEGYIMVFPTTEGGFLSPNHGEFGNDLQFLVNKMQSEGNNNASPFYQHVSDRSAIMGHSMGGGATVLAASNFSGVDCIVGLAPAETDPSAIAAAINVSAPAMILSGSSDGVTPPADHHIPIYDALGSDCKYFVSIENGSHCYFASNTVTCTLGEIIPGSLDAEAQRQVSYAVCKPWFAYFLKDDCDAWDDFQTALNTETDLGTINSECTVTAPMIGDNGGTLESDQQPNYQWYLNGNEIPNADQQAFAYSQSGTYQVGTIILGNCPTLSNEIVVQITGIVEPELTLNPTGSGLLLSTRDELDEVTIEWFDLSGKLVDMDAIGRIPSQGSLSLQKPFFTGVKLLRIRSRQATRTWKLY